MASLQMGNQVRRTVNQFDGKKARNEWAAIYRARSCTAKLRFHLHANGGDKGSDRPMIDGSLYHQLPSELLRIA